ncbi:MAG TPA: hypothetical protein VFR09_02380 [Alphaproteobacteria bacterium]|nr:hypothetical protein [Alphaproteobacteria bacterium]
MKSKFKSAFITMGIQAALVLCLSACGENNDMPKVFGGNEIPKDVLNEPRVVQKPSQEQLANKTWPRLGDVPSMPKTFSPAPVTDQAITDMENERKQAEVVKEQYEETSQTQPAAR